MTYEPQDSWVMATSVIVGVNDSYGGPYSLAKSIIEEFAWSSTTTSRVISGRNIGGRVTWVRIVHSTIV